MGFKIVHLIVALSSIVFFILYVKFSLVPFKKEFYLKPQYFGKGDFVEDDPKIRKFKIAVSDVVLQDLKDRIKNFRLGHEQLEDVKDFEYGFNLQTLLNFRDYWINIYDWRKYEAILNSFPQFTTIIDGLKIHFLHVRPPVNTYKKVFPLLLLHGWPGNVFEYYKIIPMLTDPISANIDCDFAFEIVAPSLPGYGWSEQPHKRGFDAIASARIFNSLMTKRLNFTKYIVEGSDWGSLNAVILARIFPSHIIGIHINMVFVKFDNVRNIWQWIVNNIVPSQFFSNKNSHNFSLKNHFSTLLKEGGYFLLQATKPDTIGTALNDSPIGLMVYILEKYSTWTKGSFLYEKDGGLTKKFTKDELLTIVTIYWVNSNILSSQRYYCEFYKRLNDIMELEKQYVTVPTGVAVFKNDLFSPAPKEFYEWEYNLTQVTIFEDGGHFPAFEVPEKLAKDIFKFAVNF